MSVLVAADVIVGLVGLGNLVLCFGIIRRLREHTELLDRRDDGPAGASVMLDPGASVGEYEALTTEGQAATRAQLTSASRATLVGFFTPYCDSCVERLPAFVDYARAHPGGRDQVLAVVVGADSGAVSELVATLNEVARVVRDPNRHTLTKAFAVRGFPAFALVEPDGIVRTSGFDTAVLPALTVA